MPIYRLKSIFFLVEPFCLSCFNNPPSLHSHSMFRLTLCRGQLLLGGFISNQFENPLMRLRDGLRVEQLEDRLVPTTFVVTDPLDSLQATSGTDDPTDANGLISLRSAIDAANVDASLGTSDSINFAASLAGATIELTQGELELSGSGGTITIDGSQLATPVSISGGGNSRVFLVDPEVQAVFDGLTITDGHVANNANGGGAVENNGNLIADDVAFTANTTAGNGGAIENISIDSPPLTACTLALTDCTFTDNSSGQAGGAIANSASLTITGGSFTDNTATSEGGAIYNYIVGATIAATGTTFTGNSAPFGGAITNNSGPVTITGCTFENNTAANDGGAIDNAYQQASLTVSTSEFLNNSATFGGGLEVYESTIGLNNCTLQDNAATDSGGAIDEYFSQVTANGCDFSSNTAAQGKDINLGSSGVLLVTAGTELLPDGLFASGGQVSVTGPSTELTAGGEVGVSGCTVIAENGATLNLPTVLLLSSTSGSMEAKGDGSVLNLPALTTIATSDWSLEALDGGTVKLPVLSSIRGNLDGTISFLTDTGDSTIEAPNLTDLEGVWVTLDGTDTQVAAPWITLSQSVLSITGGSYDIPGLNDAFGSDIWAQGGNLNLPSLTQYSTNGGDSIEALDGSILELNALANVSTSGSNGAATISSSGNGSVVELPELTSVSGRVTISMSNGGDIEMDTLTSTLAPSASSTPSGAADPVTLQVTDVDGDPLKFTGLTVAFSLGSPSGGQGTFSSVTDNNNGTYTATFTGTTSGSNTITAAINSAAVTSTPPSIAVTPGPVSLTTSLLTLSAYAVQLGGATTVTLQARDAAGNDLTSGGLSVAAALSSAGGGRGTLSAFTDHHNGTYTATFTGTVDGSNTIAATIGGQSIVSTAPIGVSGAAVSTSKSTVTVSALSVASGNTVTVTLQAEDAKRNKELTGGLTVVFGLTSAKGGQGTFSAVTDHGNGIYTATFKGTLEGTNTIAATIDAAKVTSAAESIKVTPGPVSAATSTVSVSSSSVKAGSAVTVTVQAKDAAGNKLTSGGQTVIPSLGAGTGTGTFSAFKDNKNGTYTAKFTGKLIGSNTIKATIGGQAIATISPSITVTPGAASAAHSVVSLSEGTVTAGNSIVVTLQAYDASGNTVSTGGSAVVFELGSSKAARGTFSKVTDHKNGTYTATFTGTIAGSNTITATIGGVKLVAAGPAIAVAPGAVSLAKSVVTLSAASVTVGSSITATLQAEDAYGNTEAVGGLIVAFALGSSSGHEGTFGSTTFSGNGEYTATFAAIDAGSNTIKALIDGSPTTSKAPTIKVK